MVRFSKLSLDEHGKPVETDVREIARESIGKCPYFILLPEHYRKDGSCRCNDARHTEMKKWGYTWNGSRWSA